MIEHPMKTIVALFLGIDLSLFLAVGLLFSGREVALLFGAHCLLALVIMGLAGIKDEADLNL